MKKILCAVLALVLVLAQIPAVFAEETVTLRFSWWGGEERHENTLKAIALFEEAHPNIKIQAEYSGWDGYKDKLLTQLAGGTAPDIIQLDQPWLAEMTENGANFVDFNTIADKVDFSDMGDEFLAGYCTLGGKLLGLPTGLNAVAMFQNTAMLQEYGVEIPETWTWENMIPAAKALHDANPEKYLLSHDNGVLSGIMMPVYMVQHASGNYVTEDYTLDFTVEDLEAYYQWVMDMFEVGGLEPETQAGLYMSKIEQNPKYIAGDFAIMSNWCSTYAQSSKDAGFADAIDYPRLENGVEDTVTVRPSQIIVLNGDSAQVEAAAEFVNFFFNNEDAICALGTCRSIPSGEKARALLSEKDMIDPQVAKSIDLAVPRAARPMSSVYNNTEIQKIFGDCMELLCYGMQTPREAAEDCYEQLLDKLEELKDLQ